MIIAEPTPEEKLEKLTKATVVVATVAMVVEKVCEEIQKKQTNKKN